MTSIFNFWFRFIQYIARTFLHLILFIWVSCLILINILASSSLLLFFHDVFEYTFEYFIKFILIEPFQNFQAVIMLKTSYHVHSLLLGSFAEWFCLEKEPFWILYVLYHLFLNDSFHTISKLFFICRGTRRSMRKWRFLWRIFLQWTYDGMITTSWFWAAKKAISPIDFFLILLAVSIFYILFSFLCCLTFGKWRPVTLVFIDDLGSDFSFSCLLKIHNKLLLNNSK